MAVCLSFWWYWTHTVCKQISAFVLYIIWFNSQLMSEAAVIPVTVRIYDWIPNSDIAIWQILKCKFKPISECMKSIKTECLIHYLYICKMGKTTQKGLKKKKIQSLRYLQTKTKWNRYNISTQSRILQKKSITNMILFILAQ